MSDMEQRLTREQPVAVWSEGMTPCRPDGAPFDSAIFADGSIYEQRRRRPPDATAEEMRQFVAGLEFPGSYREACEWRAALARSTLTDTSNGGE